MPPDNTAVALEAARKPIEFEPGPFEYMFLATFIAMLLALAVWVVFAWRKRLHKQQVTGVSFALNPGEEVAPEWGESLVGSRTQNPAIPSADDKR